MTATSRYGRPLEFGLSIVPASADLEALLVSAARLWGDEGTPPALAHEGLTFALH